MLEDMKLDLPRYTERFGATSLHGVQRVYELDSGFYDGSPVSESIVNIGNNQIVDIERRMAIVIPTKGERLRLLEGVLSGIPHDCLTIIVSNSARQPVDRYKLEKEALQQFNRFVGRNAFILHQRDPVLSEVLRDVGYNRILGPDGMVRSGKAEGMVIGMLLAKMAGKEYVGFTAGAGSSARGSEPDRRSSVRRTSMRRPGRRWTGTAPPVRRETGGTRSCRAC